MAETSKSTEKKFKKIIESEEIEKSQENEAPAEEPQGQFQLNDLMTRILEEELKTIMIEVWRALPDDPTEAEKFVIEKLRCETSDDLRNALGLNVTKRLLNIYNPLIVKLQFSCLPKIQIFAQFLKKYNVKTYRRFNKDFSIFVVRLTSIIDFDKLCTNKDLRCGNAKVTATPIYKFSKCPDKLIYNCNDEEQSKNENKEYDNAEAKDADMSEVGDSTKEETKTKGHEKKNKDEDVIEKNIITPVKGEGKKTLHPDTATKVEKNDSNTKITTDKEKDKKETKTAVSDKKPKGETVKRITTQTKNKIANPKTETDKINKTNTKNDKSKTTSLKKLTKQKHFFDEEIMEDEIQKFNAGDEMNDEEILALISEGVVVDECTRSDGE